MDALSYSVCGVRPDLDLFAHPGQAFTCEYKWQPFDDLASFNCLLLHDFRLMPKLVAAAASHKCLAFLVVPV